jgi:hypothetical protein
MSDDASFRRYTRLFRGSDSVLLMDSPPPMEYVWKFAGCTTVAKNGLNRPAIHAVDDCHGLLLEQDFGDLTATRYVYPGMADDAHTPQGQPPIRRSNDWRRFYPWASKPLSICINAGWRPPTHRWPTKTKPPSPLLRLSHAKRCANFPRLVFARRGLPPADAECQRLWHQACDSGDSAARRCVPEGDDVARLPPGRPG